MKPPLVLAALTALCLASNVPAAGDGPTCQSLRETLTRARWLCLPLSRLVVNPTYAPRPPMTSTIGDPLSTDLAFYVGEEPVRLPAFLSWPMADEKAAIAGQALDFAPSAWKTSGATAGFAAGRARVTPTGDYGSLDRSITIDLDRTPQILLHVAAGTGSWALKVNDGSRAVDVALIADTSGTGEFTADVSAATGWHGVKAFTVRLFAVGGPRTSVTFSRLSFFGLSGHTNPTPRHSVWDPHQVVTHGDGAVGVEATTALADESTVVQRLRVVRAGTGRLRLTGQFSDGETFWDDAHHALTLLGARYHAVLAFSRPAPRWLGVRPSSVAWLTGQGRPNRAGPGVWALTFDNLGAGDEVVVAARFMPTTQGTEATRKAAQRLATPAAFGAALRRQETAWDRRLADVPRPLDFTPRAVDPLGVSAADVRRTYYRAWAFLLADTLPPMPENGFPSPQCACGKPSLWAEGAPQARPSAQWESFLAMQALALVDPQTAWAALKGQLTQMGPDGSINGEGLPSCHMQTAWVLYQATGDRKRLAKNYPALKKLLQWKIRDPRWIFKGSTPPGMKDNEFVVHALTDTEFAGRIAGALGKADDVPLWQAQRAALARNFHRWFWQAPAGPMSRIYDTDGDKRSGANEAWNLQGLTLAPDILTAPERDNLLADFHAKARPDRPFLIPRLSRFPNYEPTWKGLWLYGQAAEAARMADAGMRDVTRAGEFSETYGEDAGRPVPDGVRPSVFGARHAIDDVLWHNGIVYDEGLPILLAPPSVGGVTNLRVRGVPISVTFGPAPGRVTLSGPGLKSLRLPTAMDGTRWQGAIAPGRQLALESR